MTSTDAFDRRTVLKAAGATVATGLLAGCSDDGGSDDGNDGNDGSDGNDGNDDGGGEELDFDGWFDGVDNYDGVVDETGSDAVTVTVGAAGNGGSFGFDPAAIRIDAGTTVTFEWVSNTHNVAVDDQPTGAGWEGHETIEDDGFSFEHTFDAEGTYRYLCEPHEAMGMKGGIVVE